MNEINSYSSVRIITSAQGEWWFSIWPSLFSLTPFPVTGGKKKKVSSPFPFSFPLLVSRTKASGLPILPPQAAGEGCAW